MIAAMTDTPESHASPDLTALMAGAGDPADVADVVRFWLGTRTWDASFEVLQAGRGVLVSQDGLDAVLQLAGDDERSVHAAILQAVVGGLDIDFVRLLVTNRKAATEVARQALRNGHDPVLRVVLALNTPLGASAEGAALFLASRIASGEQQEALDVARAAATSDAAAAVPVADQLELLVAEDLVSREAVEPLVAVLCGGG